MSNVTDEASDFLKQSAGDLHPGFKFAAIGDTLKGVICEQPKVVETPHLQTGTPEKKLVVAVKDDNDEVWALWIKRGFLARAVNDAVEDAGANGLAEGGTIAVRFSEERDTGKPSKAKVFEAKYQPPAAPTVSTNDLF